MSSDEKKVLKLLLINLLKNLEENPGLSEDLEAFQSQPSKIDIAQEEKIKKLKQIVARLAEDGLL